jgi:S-adenosylmethionine-diacylgycerolhomoserine-N-methlytransferase
VNLERYYRFHAGIYDWTRWSFLFGRRGLVEDVASRSPGSVLEIGCGTGSNLLLLARKLPEAELFGIDLSEDMLGRAQRKLAPFGGRVRLLRGRYPEDLKTLGWDRRYDLLLFSYSLSMFGHDFRSTLEAASQSLSSRGLVAALDFHDCRLPGFRRWMRLNHVRLDGHLLPALRASLATRYFQVHPVLFGAWSYFSFVGARR